MDFSDTYNNLVGQTEDLSKYNLEELEELLHDAKDIQNQYDNLQLVVKCDANSLYGVSASEFFSLHDVDIAEDITCTGRHYAVIADRAINKFFVNWGETELKIIQEFYPDIIELRKFTEYEPDTYNDLCVYGDTDSRYIDFEKIYSLLITKDGPKPLPESDDELSDFGVLVASKFLDKIIADTIEADSDYRNARKTYTNDLGQDITILKMNHEVTTRKCIFQKKKKYIMTSIWVDGKKLKSPKIKFKGVEIKRGSTSEKSKKIIEKLLLKYLIEGYSIEDIRKECIKLIRYIKAKKEKDFLYNISSVSGLKENISKNDEGKYVSDKNHIQMQMALSWLNFIEDNKLTETYKPPFEGQKMSYYYCNESETGYKVIAIPDDVSFDDDELKRILPEPDINRMINACLMKPILRYLYEKDKIDDIDIEHFLVGAKQWNF